ncbi:MAG: GatB/YqeY domain-containing protein [Tissierellia bacterium]|nr:GatB/YqeY domain-containing protein [Tissierellia bacterium]
MSLKDKLMDDLKASMKEKQTLRKNTITMLRARIKQYEVDTREDADDKKIMELIHKELKQRRDALVAFEDSDRAELIQNTKEEISILESYLPVQLSDEKLEELIRICIKEMGAMSMKDMSKVISLAKQKAGSTAEPKRISEVVKDKLSSQ